MWVVFTLKVRNEGYHPALILMAGCLDHLGQVFGSMHGLLCIIRVTLCSDVQSV